MQKDTERQLTREIETNRHTVRGRHQRKESNRETQCQRRRSDIETEKDGGRDASRAETKLGTHGDRQNLEPHRQTHRGRDRIVGRYRGRDRMRINWTLNPTALITLPDAAPNPMLIRYRH